MEDKKLSRYLGLVAVVAFAFAAYVRNIAAVVIRTLRDKHLLKRNTDGYVDYVRRTNRYLPGII